MNIFQRYRHTVKLDRTSSRMKNKDWYRDALELDIQLHCYLTSENEADCYLYIQSKNFYEELGRLDFKLLQGDGQVEAWIQQMLQLPTVSAAKPKSLGVIFHLAYEISLAGLGPEHDDPDTLFQLRDQMEESPKEVLEEFKIHAQAAFDELGNTSPMGKKIYQSYKSFAEQSKKWLDISENTYFKVR